MPNADPTASPRGYASLEISRSRGLTWVCDISKSSTYLNSDEMAGELEDFLPRLHWAASIAVNAVDGELIQWTGDGFIAWFELQLERDMRRACDKIIEAIWYFTTFINVTQLGVRSSMPFRIRHGLTYEPDALVTVITHRDGHRSKIIGGRHVVLAFRLAGIESDFPNVATQKKIASCVSSSCKQLADLRPWKPGKEELLKYFKGQTYETKGLYLSGLPKKRRSQDDSWIPRAMRTMVRLEDGADGVVSGDPSSPFVRNFFSEMKSGPDWCVDSVDRYVEYLKRMREELLGDLNETIDIIASAPQHANGAPQRTNGKEARVG
jgi:hypothetical protein